MANTRSIDTGILILRVGVGFLFILHGWGKITGGTETWAKLGGSMSLLGIGFAPTFWGFMAAASEFSGGILLIVGLFVRPASALLLFTMIVATLFKFNGARSGDDPAGLFGAIKEAGYPLSLAFVFLAMLFFGPGLCSLSAKLKGFSGRWFS